MVERASKFVLVVAGSACFMLILYQYAGPGLSLGAPGGRAPPDDLDLFPTPDPHYEKKYYFPVRELERSLRFDMKGDDVIVFLHIQKTGGTTFGRHLVQNVRLEVPCDCRPGQKKCTCYRPNRRETWLFSRFSTGWSCGLHADWTELTNCVPAIMEKKDCPRNHSHTRYCPLSRLASSRLPASLPQVPTPHPGGPALLAFANPFQRLGQRFWVKYEKPLVTAGVLNSLLFRIPLLPATPFHLKRCADPSCTVRPAGA